MSGTALAIAVGTSLVASGASAYGQIQTANQAAELQAQEIREQQVQLRLQQNQATIERMKKLESSLATEEVMLGERNISMGSGTANAFTLNSMHNFISDEDADSLNYSSKQLALARQSEMQQNQRKALVTNAVTGFVGQSARTLMYAYAVPSSSLLDSSTGTGAAKKVITDNSFNLNA